MVQNNKMLLVIKYIHCVLHHSPNGCPRRDQKALQFSCDTFHTNWLDGFHPDEPPFCSFQMSNKCFDSHNLASMPACRGCLSLVFKPH